MKLIKPNFEIITQNPNNDGMLKHIELCGRVCYKSENKIKDDTAAIFVNGLIKSGHTSVLEHGTVYLQFEIENTTGIRTAEQHIAQKYSDNKYSKCNWSDTRAYVTTNYRVLVENKWLDDLQYQCEPTEFHEKRITVKFICDRGISHEFVRHRVFSFSQESTRYCNYSKNKFGNELTFIIPNWFSGLKLSSEEESAEVYGDQIVNRWYSSNDAENMWVISLLDQEITYIELLEKGWLSQQARTILPNSLKTELMMTGFVTDWKHFFELRCSKAAHPQSQELAIPLEEEFKKLNLI